nr:histidine ammonia-lyase [Chrysemys picta bellii]
MPRYTVHVRGEWLAVPCQTGTNTVRWLGKEAVRRYMKNKPDNGGFASVEEVKFCVRRCKGLGLLDHDDTLEDTLEDNEFVEVAIEGDVMSSDFIASKLEGVDLYSKYQEPEKYIYLDGNSLTPEDLVNLGKGLYKIKLTPEAEAKVRQSREVIERIVKEQTVVYGITTGFGKFARTIIPTSKLKELQVNLVRSHSAGVGKPLIPARTRMLLALRINVLAKGYSGISLETLQQVIEAFNASCLPYIPEKGTVGASGDLAPLSHLALGFIGEGKMWSPKCGWADAKYVRSMCLTTRLLCLSPSIESHRFCDRVQDAYTLRCCPQVHGVANDTIAFVKDIITTEINSATDNPIVFAERGETISGGNFHGEYPAKALDYLAIGVHELAAISERRIERLCNPSLSELPAFLVTEGGLNSGFMIAHCTAAALGDSLFGFLVLAIELLAACQGIEFLRPLRTTTPLEKVYDLVRSVVRPWLKDRFMAPDIEAAHRLLVEQKVWEVAVPYIEKYRREHIPESRPVSPTAFSLDSLRMNKCVGTDHSDQD